MSAGSSARQRLPDLDARQTEAAVFRPVRLQCNLRPVSPRARRITPFVDRRPQRPTGPRKRSHRTPFDTVNERIGQNAERLTRIETLLNERLPARP